MPITRALTVPCSRLFLPLLALLLWAAPGVPAQAPGAQNGEFRFALLQDHVRPGEPLTAIIAGAGLFEAGEPALRAILVVGGNRLTGASFFPLALSPGQGAVQAAALQNTGQAPAATEAGEPPCAVALLGIPSTARAGPALIRFEAGGVPIGELAFAIEERHFEAEVIPLNQANTELRAEPDIRKTREAEQLWAILGWTGRDIYAPGPFVPPVSSTRRTSFFGDRRVYRYADGKQDTAIHAGVDYGVPTGTPVNACGDGKVVLARARIVTGNTVIIEHLPGLYSLYYHLDSIAAAEGQMVKAGQLIGRSGATGLATGPHLHWEIRVSGENTDPDAFLAQPVIDTGAILGKMGF